MALTKHGVCYQIKESPFTFEWRGIIYFFSSEHHRARFEDKILEREQWLDDSLSRRFKCSVHMPILADIQLYTQIETRGFYIQTNDGAEYDMPCEVYVEANMEQVGVTDGWI